MSAPEYALMGAQTGNCVRVAVALEVLGLPFEPIPVDLRGGEQRLPAFLAINPAGQVPVLLRRRPGQPPTVLTQANAILLHLCETHPGQLLPLEGTPDRERALERYFYYATDVIAVGGGSFVLGRAGHDDAAELLMRRAIDAIAASERFCVSHAYMAGEQLTLADIAAVTSIHAYSARVPWDELPHLRRWYERVIARADVRRGMVAFAPDKP